MSFLAPPLFVAILVTTFIFIGATIRFLRDHAHAPLLGFASLKSEKTPALRLPLPFSPGKRQ